MEFLFWSFWRLQLLIFSSFKRIWEEVVLNLWGERGFYSLEVDNALHFFMGVKIFWDVNDFGLIKFFSHLKTLKNEENIVQKIFYKMKRWISLFYFIYYLSLRSWTSKIRGTLPSSSLPLSFPFSDFFNFNFNFFGCNQGCLYNLRHKKKKFKWFFLYLHNIIYFYIKFIIFTI